MFALRPESQSRVSLTAATVAVKKRDFKRFYELNQAYSNIDDIGASQTASQNDTTH